MRTLAAPCSIAPLDASARYRRRARLAGWGVAARLAGWGVAARLAGWGVAALLVCASVGANAAERREAKLVERVVAVVNDDLILLSEVDQVALVQLSLRPDFDPSSEEGRRALVDARKKVLDSLIDSNLIRQQAAELKITVANEDIDRALDEVKRQNNLDDETFSEALRQQGFSLDGYRRSLRKQLLEMKVMRAAVQSRIQVSDDEVKAFYNQNAARMSNDQEMHLKMVLVGVPADAPAEDVERKRKVATQVLDLARQGKSWVELAKAYSDDALTREEGGDLGWVGRDTLVAELEELVAKMAPGDVRGPIRTARGWHVIQLVERKAADLRPLEEVREQLRRQLMEQQMEKSSQAWMKELRRKALIDVRL